MRDIISWLLEVEHLANELYQSASEYFIDNKQLHIFLKHTAEDEAWHYHVMGSASNYFQQHKFPISPITLDDGTKDRIKSVFSTNIEAMANKTLTEMQLVDCIIETEFSEWNDFFLYVVNTLKVKKPEFEYVASIIQHHLNHVEKFVEIDWGYPQMVEKLKKLPAVYTEKILVVEDDQVFAGLLEAIFSREGTVHLARHGREAIEKIDQNYYKLIVSDVDMPIMDGLSFYKEAVTKYPKLNEIFIFLTGDLSPDRVSFFKKNGLPCLEKPATLKDIRRVTTEIMYRLNSEK